MAKAKSNSGQSKEPKNYNHGQTHPQRPDIGTEPHFTLPWNQFQSLLGFNIIWNGSNEISTVRITQVSIPIRV